MQKLFQLIYHVQIFEDRFDFTENKSSMYKNYFHLFFNIFFNLFKNSTKKEKLSKTDTSQKINHWSVKIIFIYFLTSFLIYSKIRKSIYTSQKINHV